MKHNIPARTLRDWMKRLNIKSVFTHHSHNKERGGPPGREGEGDGGSLGSASPDMAEEAQPVNLVYNADMAAFPGMEALMARFREGQGAGGVGKGEVEQEIDDDEEHRLRIDETPGLEAGVQIAQPAS